MTGIVEFLRARLDEDEAAARAAGGQCWSLDGGMCCVASEAEGIIAQGEAHGPIRTSHVQHIARWDPARVLAEVAAKRAVLEAHSPAPAGYLQAQGPFTDNLCRSCCMARPYRRTSVAVPCGTLKALARIYADHLDFDPAWKADA